MRSGPAATLGVLLGLALILPACGESGTGASGGEGTTASKESPAADRQAGSSESPAADRRTASANRTKARAPSAARQCVRTLGEFLDSMESMANTLAVGVDYDSYMTTLSRVRATYAGVDADRLGLVCLGRVAGAAERSLNTYIAAANQWGECLATASCKISSIEPQLQRKWEQASDQLSDARSGLGLVSLTGRGRSSESASR